MYLLAVVNDNYQSISAVEQHSVIPVALCHLLGMQNTDMSFSLVIRFREWTLSLLGID